MTPEDAVSLIEHRRGTWIAFKADVSLRFSTPAAAQASCRGHLLYKRLDEKILLECFDSAAKSLFIFKTEDKNFQLYLPAQKSIFSGTLFDLEDSPDIESHLKPLDLYRALKPASLSTSEIILRHQEKNLTELKVRSTGMAHVTVRRLIVTKDGDVINEAYYNSKGKIILKIVRALFKKENNGREKVSFPRQIKIISYRKKSLAPGWDKTGIIFKNISFLPDITDQEFELLLPEDIRKISIESDLMKEQA